MKHNMVREFWNYYEGAMQLLYYNNIGFMHADIMLNVLGDSLTLELQDNYEIGPLEISI